MLNIGFIVLLSWHMIMTIGKIFFSTYKAEMIYAGFLFLVSFIYIVLCRVRWKGTQSRINLITSRIRTPNQFICIIFFIWYIFSLLINKGPRVKDNFWLLYDVGINCLFLFNLSMIVPEEKRKKTIDLLLYIVSLVGLCYVIYGLWHLFTLNFIHLESGEFIGMTHDYHFELGLYYNPTAAIFLSLILISIYMIATQNKTIRIFYVLSLIPYTLALYLTNARGSFIAGVFAYFCFIFLIIWNNLKQTSIVRRFFVAFFAAAATATVIWDLRPIAFQFFESVTHFSTGGIVSPTAKFPDKNGYNALFSMNEIHKCIILFAFPAFIPKDKIKKLSKRVKSLISRPIKILIITALLFFFCTISQYIGNRMMGFNIVPIEAENISTLSQNTSQTRKEYARDMDDFNTIRAREIIWKNAIKVMKSDWKTFLFGVTPLGFDDALKRIGENSPTIYTAHNELLNMGVSLGVPMMFTLLALFISTAIMSIRLGLSGRNQYYKGAFILPVIFFTFIVATLIEGYLFASFTISSSLFFLVSGWINTLDNTHPA